MHFGRGGDQRAGHRAGVTDLALKASVLALDAVELEGAAYDEAELIDVDRLLVEVIGTGRDGPERALAGAVTRGDDNLGIGLQRENGLERRETLAHAVGIGREAEIGRDHGWTPVTNSEFGCRTLLGKKNKQH